MTLRLAHELGIALATTFSMLAVLPGGELPTVAWLCVLAPALSAWMHLKGRAAPAASGTLIALASLGLGLATLVQQDLESAVLGAALALLGILVDRLLTRRGTTHDLQALLVSLLLMISGTVLHTQATFGPVFVGYAVFAVWALVARQLVRSAEREASREGGVPLAVTIERHDVITPTFFGVTGLMAVGLLVSTSVLFVLFPRVSPFNLGNRARVARFPQSVSLRGPPRVSAASGVIARLKGLKRESWQEGLYLRGAVYDRVSSSGFERSPDLPWLHSRERRIAGGALEATYQIYVQPVAGATLFSLGEVITADPLAGGGANPSFTIGILPTQHLGELRATRPLTGPFRYQVTGTLNGAGRPPGEDERGAASELRPELATYFLALPKDLNPQIRALALEVTQGKSTPRQRAAALRSFLLDNFAYGQEQTNGDKADPLHSFLFEDRRGHCEYFATAFAVMLRATGVPARVVGGYQGGSWDDDARIASFTTNNAHAWVEWFLPEAGWVVDDATPLVSAPRNELLGSQALLERLRRTWDDYVMDFGLDHQLALAKRAFGVNSAREFFSLSFVPWRKVGAALVFLALLAGAIYWLRLRSRRKSHNRNDVLNAFYRAHVRILGEEPPSTSTLRKARTRLEAALRGDAQGANIIGIVNRVLITYEEERFGGKTFPPEERAFLIQALEEATQKHQPQNGEKNP
jgi:hypothetical protein